MKLTFTNESDFRRERDFSTKINATFEFIGAHFRPLLKSLAYFVLPGALLSGIGMGLMFGNLASMAPDPGSSGSPPDVNTSTVISALSGTGLFILGITAAVLLLISTAYGYVRVRLAIPPDEVVQPAQVWVAVRSRLGRMLLSWLVFAGIGMVAMGIVGAISFGIFGTALSGNDFGTAFSIFGIFFLVMLVFMWVGTVLSLYFPILLIEDVSIRTALQRSFYLVQGKWWSTFGLLMVSSMIQSFITYIFAIPMYGIIVAQALKVPGLTSPVISIITTSFYTIGLTFTYVIPLFAIMFQYFNLVERKDGTGLRQLVDSLGQTAAPEVSGTYYRPDEEGEY